jgi:hypothetical protein
MVNKQIAACHLIEESQPRKISWLQYNNSHVIALKIQDKEEDTLLRNAFPWLQETPSLSGHS